MIVTRKCHECGKKNRFDKDKIEGPLRCKHCDARIRRSASDDGFISHLKMKFGPIIDYHRSHVVLGLVIAAAAAGVYFWSTTPNKLAPLSGDSIARNEAGTEQAESEQAERHGEPDSPDTRSPVVSESEDSGSGSVWAPRAFESELVWNGVSERSIPIGRLDKLAISGVPVRFVTNEEQLFDVATGEEKSLVGARPEAVRTAVSPDGKWHALATPIDEKTANLEILLPGSSRSSPIRLAAPAESLEVLAFLPGNQLMAQSSYAVGGRVSVWKPSGAKTHEFDTPAFSRGSYCVNADGSRIAIASAVSIDVYEMETGTRVSIMSVVDSVLPMSAVRGMAFAPDGKDLAALMSDGRFVVWDVAGGAIRIEYGLKQRAVPDSIAPVQWLPDGRGWLLSGSLLLSEPLAEVWRVTTSEDAESIGTLIVDHNHVVVPRKKDAGWFLDAESIPWNQIDEARLLVPERTLFREGSAISVIVNTDGDDSQLKQRVQEAIAARFEAMGCSVEGGARAKFVAELSETRGNRKPFKGGEYEDQYGAPVYPTDITCRLRMQGAGADAASLWEHSFVSDGGEPPLSATTHARLRERAIAGVLRRITTLTLPGRLVEDPNNQLLIVD